MNRNTLPMQGRGSDQDDVDAQQRQRLQQLSQHQQRSSPPRTGQSPLMQPSPMMHSLQQLQQQGPASPGRLEGGHAPGGGGRGGGGTGEKPTYAKRGKITIVACVPCRRRKTKCDGHRPSCTQCDARDGQCSYDMTDDQRKLTVLRDNVEQLQEKSNSLEALLSTIQRASEEEAQEIYRRLRSGIQVQNVAELVMHGQLLSGVGGRMDSSSVGSRMDPQLETQGPYGQIEHSPDPRLREYETLMDAIRRAEPPATHDILRRIRHEQDVSQILSAVAKGETEPRPLMPNINSRSPSGLESDFSQQHQVFGLVKGSLEQTHAHNAQESPFYNPEEKTLTWTNVTQDGKLVEHLIDLYFTWQHCFFQSFPEKLFRQDFEAGNSKYCSKALVNAICAAGCFFSDRPEVKRDRGGGRRLVSDFYDEAVSDFGVGPRPSVTNTAALFLICYVEGTRGKLSNLWNYSGRSALMAMDLGLHLKASKSRQTSQTDAKEAANEVKARSHAFWGCFHVDQLTAFTLGRLPLINSHGVTCEWPVIDKEEDEQPWTAYGMQQKPKRGARGSVFRYCAMLSSIINSTLLMFFAPTLPLSASLLLEEYDKYLDWERQLPAIVADLDNAPPHVLTLHMYYHTAILLLFRPFLKATLHGSEVVPREVCRASANAISELWLRHNLIYGVTGIYMFQVHCLLTACTIHIIGMPNISDTNYFTKACNFFQQLVESNEWARSSLEILRGLVEKWELVIPQEAEEALYRGTDRGSGQPQARGQSRPAASSSRQPTAKRSSSRTDPIDPALEQQAPVTQKRQRVGRSQQAYPNLNPILDPKDKEQPQSPSQYIYSPIVDQQVPMLAPARSSSRSNTDTPARQEDEEPNAAAAAEETGEGSGQGKQAESSESAPRQPPAAAQRGGATAAKGRKKRGQRNEGSARTQGQGGQVEGMSFEEDWRDPFMGYLGD